MSKIITSSSNISILESNVVADLCEGKFFVDLSQTTFIGTGADNALGAKVRITNPYNVPIKDFSSSYDIAAPFTGVFEFNISTSGGNYEYGEFTIDVQITDSDNATYTVTKNVELSYPDINNRSRKYGSLGASIKGVCKEGAVYVAIDSLPTYRGIIADGVSQSFELEYPTGSGLAKATRTLSYFADNLFEGVYRIKGDVCATYNGSNNISYKVPYKVDYKKEVLCQIDECAVLANLVQIDGRLNESCSEEQKLEYGTLTVEVLRLLKTAQLANDCGQDASDYIKQLEDLLPGLRCSEDLGKAPVVNAVPASSIVIEGCNIEESVDGLTRHYKFNNYTYEVAVAPNGGFLTVSNAQIAGCTSTQTLTFDIAKVYTQVKNYANQDINEANFWASIINKTTTGSTPLDGISQSDWDAMTLIQKIQAIISALNGVDVTQVNADWSASSGAAEILNKPDIPPTPTFNNGVTVVTPRSGSTPAVVGLGSPLLHDTTIAGAFKLAFTQARLGIGMVPVFPLDIYLNDNNYNLAGQITAALALQNGKARIGLLSSMQIFGNSFTATNLDQVSGKTGQLVFYNTGAHVLNAGASYAGNVGILIGYATGSVSGSIISALAGIINLGKTGTYDEVAGLRISTPAVAGFIDAANFSGSVNDLYGVVIEPFPSNATLGEAVVWRKWGFYQKGNDPNKLFGKLTFDTGLNAGTGTTITVNKPQGTFTIPAGATSAVVNNNMVTPTSVVWVQNATLHTVGDSTPVALPVSMMALEADAYFTVFLDAPQSIPVKVKFIVH